MTIPGVWFFRGSSRSRDLMMSMAPPWLRQAQRWSKSAMRRWPAVVPGCTSPSAMGMPWAWRRRIGTSWNSLMQSLWEIATDCWILDLTVVLLNSIGLYRTCWILLNLVDIVCISCAAHILQKRTDNIIWRLAAAEEWPCLATIRSNYHHRRRHHPRNMTLFVVLILILILTTSISIIIIIIIMMMITIITSVFKKCQCSRSPYYILNVSLRHSLWHPSMMACNNPEATVLSELSWLRFLVEVCRDFDLMAAWQRSASATMCCSIFRIGFSISQDKLFVNVGMYRYSHMYMYMWPKVCCFGYTTWLIYTYMPCHCDPICKKLDEIRSPGLRLKNILTCLNRTLTGQQDLGSLADVLLMSCWDAWSSRSHHGVMVQSWSNHGRFGLHRIWCGSSHYCNSWEW